MIEYTWKYEIPKEIKNAYWEQEVFRTLYTVCVKASTDLGVKGWGGLPITENSCVLVRLEADIATICALESLEQFELSPGENTLSMCYRVGTLGRFEVWRNLQADHNYILISYNGKVARINIEGLCQSSVT